MKLFLTLLVLGLILSIFGPWWSIALISFAVCYQMAPSSKSAFGLSSLAGIGIWVGGSLVGHLRAEAPITDKMAGLFQSSISALNNLPNLAVILLFVVIVSGLIGGLSGLAGYQVKQLFK